MSNRSTDSYTGEPLTGEAIYRSKIRGINEGRGFYKKGQPWKCSVQYRVEEEGPIWRLHRENTASTLFPTFETEEIAVRVMDWCVRNDASVELAIVHLLNGELDPLLRLLGYIERVVHGTEPDSIQLTEGVE